MQLRLHRFDLLLFRLYQSVAYFGNPSVIAFALGFLCLKLQVFDIDLVLLNLVDLILLALPLGHLRLLVFLQIGNLFVKLLQLLHIVLAFDSFALDLKLFDTSAHLVQRLRNRIHLQTQTCSSFIHQVDSLIGQKPIGDIAMRQVHSRDNCIVFDTHLVVIFVLLLQAT